MEKSMNDKDLEQDNLQATDDSITDTSEAVDQTTTTAQQSDVDTGASDDAGGKATADAEDAVLVSDSETTESVDDAAAARPAQQNAEKDKKSRSWIGVLAFVLAICALIVAGYGYQKLQELKAETAALKASAGELSSSVDQNLQKSLSEASSAGSKAAAASSQIGSLKSELAAQQKNVDELQDRLTRSMKQISQIGTNKRKDWLLAEVEYLLRLANQRVMMEKSPVGALALLKSSDQILQETDDVSIYNVRKAIASDVAALEAVPRLDVDGIFLKLAALNQQVSKLRLIPVSDRRELPELLEKVTAESVSESWNQGIKASWNETMNKLEKLVVIQQRDEPIEPLLSPEQVYFLQQNLHLMIEQAQLSLLQGQQGSYDASLAKAADWVGKYFEAKDPTTQALLKGINDLKPVVVSPELPDITSSLKALKSYLADVHKVEGAA